MADSDWLTVAQISDLPKGKTLCVEFRDQEVLLCHNAEGLFAVNNLCSHAEARLSEGKMKGSRILCPLHGAAFDIKTGEALSRPASQPISCYRVRRQGDDIQLAD